MKLFSKNFRWMRGNAWSRQAVSWALGILAAIAAAKPAYAQINIIPADFSSGVSLGNMMCDLSYNIAPFEPLMAGIAYIAGAVFIGSGLLQLVKHNDGRFSHEHPLHRPIAHIVAGTGLLAFPAFLSWCVGTIFGFELTADFGGGLSGCSPIVDYAGVDGDYGLTTDIGLDGLMMNLIMNIKSPMIFMLSVMCIVIGIFLVLRGLVKASKFGTDPKAYSVPNILASLVIGTIIYTIGTSMNAILGTVFGDASVWGDSAIMSAISYDFGAGTVPFQQAVYAALTFFQMIGMIAFIRGWLILKDAVEGQGQKTVAQGLTHILGGVLAVNIYRFLEVMDTTFGTGFLS